MNAEAEPYRVAYAEALRALDWLGPRRLTLTRGSDASETRRRYCARRRGRRGRLVIEQGTTRHSATRKNRTEVQSARRHLATSFVGEPERAEGTISYPLGRQAVGSIVYTDDGYMSVAIMSPDRLPFAEPGSAAVRGRRPARGEQRGEGASCRELRLLLRPV